MPLTDFFHFLISLFAQFHYVKIKLMIMKNLDEPNECVLLTLVSVVYIPTQVSFARCQDKIEQNI